MSQPTETNEALEHKKTLKWLQRLKEESWEAELLVSAIAIFGTFQLFALVEWVTNRYIELLPIEQYKYGYFIVFMGLLAVSILVSMFVIHFFLRAYWIGLVGLNSVFPDYGLEDSAYSKIYTEKILGILPRQEETIQKVDELCSVIFSAAFTILLIYAYLAVSMSIYMLIYNLLSAYVNAYVILAPVALIGLLVVVQTIFGIVGNLKQFKNNVAIQTWLFKVVKLATMVTYGPLYKNLLQVSMVFGSNFKKKKSLVALILLFFVSGMCVANVKVNDTNIFYLIQQDVHYADQMHLSYYYDQNPENSFLVTPQIQSDIIEGKTVKLFIPIFNNERNYQDKTCGEYVDDEQLDMVDNKILARKFYLDCYQKYHKIKVNGATVNVDFLKKNHQTSEQFGMVGFIDKELLRKGKNTIEVTKTLGDVKAYNWTIPFYFQPSSGISQ
tara:strand:- start:32482 stop:33804 length:1323 start_codon:yes stop_codon:yes gene_type:complete